MATIRLSHDAAKDILEWAREYGKRNRLHAGEMGAALVFAGAGLLSVRMNSVQLQELWEQVSGLSAPLRKPNAS